MLEEAGLPAPEENLIHANFRVDGGYTAFARLVEMREPPDAVLATNNLVGVGLLRALADRGGRPAASPAARRDDDGESGSGRLRLGVAVIGDLPFATSPTSDVLLVPLNPRELGVTAARMLLERIGGLEMPARHVTQGTPAIVNGSTTA
jgi:LacI family transcriptional regulator